MVVFQNLQRDSMEPQAILLILRVYCIRLISTGITFLKFSETDPTKFGLRKVSQVQSESPSNGTDAIRLIDELKPDVAFLDIMMPRSSGVDVVGIISHRPQFVFTTAFEQFAVTAFELNALDYLLKPFGKKRFTRSIDRLAEADPSVGSRPDDPAQRPVKQLFVRERNRLLSIPTASIIRISAADDYAEVITSDAHHLVRVTMKQLEDQLDPDDFVFIHRGTIVNLNCVQEIASCGNGRYEVTLRDGATCIASRSGAAKLRSTIGKS